jgi:hypothetical protein
MGFKKENPAAPNSSFANFKVFMKMLILKGEIS